MDWKSLAESCYQTSVTQGHPKISELKTWVASSKQECWTFIFPDRMESSKCQWISQYAQNVFFFKMSVFILCFSTKISLLFLPKIPYSIPNIFTTNAVRIHTAKFIFLLVFQRDLLWLQRMITMQLYSWITFYFSDQKVRTTTFWMCGFCYFSNFRP